MQNVRKPLLWSQRLALVRHNLHIAHHTRDFGLFRALQVQTLLAQEDHVAALAEQLDSVLDISPASVISSSSSSSNVSGSRRSSNTIDADSVIANLDKLTTVIANVHEDAFTALASHVRSAMLDDPAHLVKRGPEDHNLVRESARCEATRQRSIAAASVDKMLDAAAILISQLPSSAQHEAVAVLTLGLSFVADAMAVALAQMDRIENCTYDSARIDSAAESVASIVSETVLALKGMFGLMDGSGQSSQQPALRPALEEAQERRRKSAADSSPGLARSWVRRLSSALIGSASSTPETPQSLPAFVRHDTITPAVPPALDGLRLHNTKLPRVDSSEHFGPHDVRLSSGVAHKLDPMPQTPSSNDVADEEAMDRFDFGFAQQQQPQQQPRSNQAAFGANAALDQPRSRMDREAKETEETGAVFAQHNPFHQHHKTSSMPFAGTLTKVHVS